jgi:hypothetical protein
MGLVDVAAGCGIGLLSALFLAGALQMPFQTLRWTWHDAPGFVPAVIAGVLLALALLLAGRGLRRWWLFRDGVRWRGLRSEMASWGTGRLVLTLAFALAFVILMGRLPFGVLTTLWVFGMVLTFRGTTPLRAAAVAVVTGTAVFLIFTRAFLVPLP